VGHQRQFARHAVVEMESPGHHAGHRRHQLASSNLSNAVMDGTKIRFAIFQDALMTGCRGCPTDW
jgi:hypothetical protein